MDTTIIRVPGLWVLSVLFLLSGCQKQSGAQKGPEQEVDALFAAYTGQARPGYALGIVQDGELVMAKGYGMADLEMAVPLSDSTAFYIGSMAKQFTAAALLILEAEHLLDFDAPVRHYLKDFPEYGKDITVRHLVHHTSGIRETNSLQLFQGIDRKFEQVFDTQDLYQLIIDQKELNFEPGQEFRYSSGGYAVLAKIIEQLGGMSFRAFLKTKIFDKLGMENTLVCDNHNEIVPNRAKSYWPMGDGTYERRSLVFDAYGDGGIITTVQDLAKWDKAFYQDLLGVSDFADKMYEKGQLSNGTELEYARALQIRDHKGMTMVTHNGGMLGFRVDMVRFPEQRTTFILLGNSAFQDPTGDLLRLSDLWLKDHHQDQPPIKDWVQPEYASASGVSPEALTGYYWTDEANYYRAIIQRNDTLFMHGGNTAEAQMLVPIAPLTYALENQGEPSLLTFDPDGGTHQLTLSFGGMERRFRKFDPTPPSSPEELEGYVGRYHSDELHTTYTIAWEADALVLRIDRNRPIQLFPAEKESGTIWNGKTMAWIGFGELKFHVDDQGIVTGLSIGDNRVKGVHFKKIG